MLNLKTIIGILLIITGIFDSWKYSFQAKKIIEVGTAKGMSRKFTNCAILNDIVRITYSIIIKDLYLFTINALALGCMIFLFFVTYRYYPYLKRYKLGFKRPNIILYTINSIMPNRIRRRL